MRHIWRDAESLIRRWDDLRRHTKPCDDRRHKRWFDNDNAKQRDVVMASWAPLTLLVVPPRCDNSSNLSLAWLIPDALSYKSPRERLQLGNRLWWERQSLAANTAKNHHRRLRVVVKRNMITSRIWDFYRRVCLYWCVRRGMDKTVANRKYIDLEKSCILWNIISSSIGCVVVIGSE